MGYALGIDLGTTYSAAAVAHDGSADRFPLGNRTATIPSVVCLRADGEVLVGEAAERRALLEPTRTAREFKRRLGDPTPLLLGGTPYGAEALMAYLLEWIVGRVVEQQGSAPDATVLCHPANWGPFKLDLLRQTVQLADIGDVTFVTEPEAAALHYATQERLEPGEVVAVYDFGGGTFDAAVLRYAEDGFELVGTPEGMERIGGIDFDQAVFAHVDAAMGGAVSELDPDDSSAMAAVSRLRDECQLAKEQLSQDTDVDIPVLLPGTQTEVRLTRAEFESMIRPRIGETVRALERAVRSAGVAMDDIAKVLLVGGSSRIPLVGQLVREHTGRPIAVDAHPKFAIAIGAAVVGASGSARAEPATPVAATPVAPIDTAGADDTVVIDHTDTGGPDDRTVPIDPGGATPSGGTPGGDTDGGGPADVAGGGGGAITTPSRDRGADGGDRRRLALIGGGVVAVLLVVLAVVLLGGDPEDTPVIDPVATGSPDDGSTTGDDGDDGEDPSPDPTAAVEPDAVVDGITAGSDGTIEVAFTTTGFAVGDGGYGVEIGWVDEFSQPVEGAPYQRVEEPSPYTGFTVLDRPNAAAGVCVQTITPDGDQPVEDPEHCGWLDPSIGPALPGERLIALDEVSEQDGTYVVNWTAHGFEPQLGSSGNWHGHFYWYPTSNEDTVGANLPDGERGSWVAWDQLVFDAFTTSDRPPGATHVCAVVAEFDHTIMLQDDGTGYPSGSCLVLP